MKAIRTIFFWIPVIAVACLACSKNDISPLQKLEINLVVLNEDGEKSNTVRVGTDFSIGFELINHSTDTLFLSSDGGRLLFSHLYEHDDFLLVYKLDWETGSRRFIAVGKPYDPNVALNFLDIGLPIYSITIPPKGRKYAFSCLWSNYTENQPLSAGTYYSSFSDTVIFDGEEIVIDTSIDFTVN